MFGEEKGHDRCLQTLDVVMGTRDQTCPARSPGTELALASEHR